MSEGDILSLLREALATASLMAMPLLIAALVTGLVIGLLQALTSIQEMTLTFVPKIAVIMVVFWASASMLARLVIGFFDAQVIGLIAS
ncbi:flagellar biosynthetic protein FliQ [Parvularcula sp. LCG005]|nr:flagellar biosynthetic protein FliQ [Parvularcula sp. LCG005]WOI52943.1 flagellar biosynthetic protein FliQ [Parvularcula sp. LCG005]